MRRKSIIELMYNKLDEEKARLGREKFGNKIEISRRKFETFRTFGEKRVFKLTSLFVKDLSEIIKDN